VPLVIDGVSVVVPTAVADDRFPGGMTAYQRVWPCSTFCTDGRICRVAFTGETEARAFVEELARDGFVAPWSGRTADVALVAFHVNFLYPCEWLELELQTVLADDGRRYSAPVVRLRGDESTRVAAPSGWQPGPLHRLTPAGAASDFELVESRRDGAEEIETYRNRETGQVIRIAKPAART